MRAICFILVTIIFWLTPQHTNIVVAGEVAEAKTTNVALDGVSIQLPKERWDLSRTGSDWVYFTDAYGVSNLTVWSVEPDVLYDLSGFMKTKIHRRLEGWSKPYRYRIDSEKEGVVRIGSGQEATYLMYTLDLNNVTQKVAFLYFAEQNAAGQEIRWYRIFIRGSVEFYDASFEMIKKIASGLLLTRK